jgi:hypothetical protein
MGNHTLEFSIRTILLGAGATLVMDGWAFLLRRLGVPSLDFALLGRWLGHLPKGTWIHASIRKAPPIPHERLLGWIAHYSIGISFAALLLASFGLDWAHAPSVLPALLIGVVTVLAPWFILQPALGAGIASSRTPTPMRNALKSLVTHTVFGFGLYATALLLTVVWPAGAPR